MSFDFNKRTCNTYFRSFAVSNSFFNQTGNRICKGGHLGNSNATQKVMDGVNQQSWLFGVGSVTERLRCGGWRSVGNQYADGHVTGRVPIHGAGTSAAVSLFKPTFISASDGGSNSRGKLATRGGITSHGGSGIGEGIHTGRIASVGRIDEGFKEGGRG